jgi:hypothetical protein
MGNLSENVQVRAVLFIEFSMFILNYQVHVCKSMQTGWGHLQVKVEDNNEHNNICNKNVLITFFLISRNSFSLAQLIPVM